MVKTLSTVMGESRDLTRKIIKICELTVLWDPLYKPFSMWFVYRIKTLSIRVERILKFLDSKEFYLLIWEKY